MKRNEVARQWQLDNPERYRTYQREYRRRYRAKKKLEESLKTKSRWEKPLNQAVDYEKLESEPK